VRDDEGNITHFVSVLKDITELLKKKEQEVELHLARKVQQSFYRACAEIPGFDIAASTDPADETGGDYYDFICRPDGSLCIAVGDVSGHGISSALIMAETRAYVRSLAATMVDPGEILALVNKMLHEDLKDDRFVTLLLVCLDPRTRTLTFAGAGHEFGYLLNQSGEIAHVLKSSGPPLGPFADGLFSSDETLKLEKEQILLLLTDGVTESLNRCGRESLIGQVIKYVHKNRHEPSALIAAGLCAASRSFAEDRAVQDDATAIILKVL
jgi:serine phosphatase RsbU (regulator of sigma subunit)